jgi:hypothetical protein
MIKSIFLTFSFLVLSFSLSSFGLDAPDIYVLKYDGEVLSFVDGIEKINFGTVKKGAITVATIRVINASDKMLFIANVRGSCGLSVPAWPRNPLAPGEEATIQISLDSNRTGVINRNITINANTDSSSTVIKVTGQVIEG